MNKTDFCPPESYQVSGKVGKIMGNESRFLQFCNGVGTECQKHRGGSQKAMKGFSWEETPKTRPVGGKNWPGQAEGDRRGECPKQKEQCVQITPRG